MIPSWLTGGGLTAVPVLFESMRYVLILLPARHRFLILAQVLCVPRIAFTALTSRVARPARRRAGGDGGGIANGIPLPGPMPLPGGALTLNHSQVTGNTAAHGGGIFNNGGTVTLAKTPVTGNTPDNCEPPGTIPDCTG